MSYLNRTNGYKPTGNVNGAVGDREAQVTDKFRDILEAMMAELNRAVFKHGIDRVPVNPDMDPRDSFIVLSEEVGEVARAMTYDEGDTEKLIEELIQTATMAAAMATGLRLKLNRKDV